VGGDVVIFMDDFLFLFLFMTVVAESSGVSFIRSAEASDIKSARSLSSRTWVIRGKSKRMGLHSFQSGRLVDFTIFLLVFIFPSSYVVIV